MAFVSGNRQRLDDFEVHGRKSLDCLEETVRRNMKLKILPTKSQKKV